LTTVGYRVAILDKGNGGSDGRWIKEYADANANTKMWDAVLEEEDSHKCNGERSEGCEDPSRS
jgi:hypothetical protein